MAGEQLVTHQSISFSAALRQVFQMAGISIPQPLIDAALRAARISSSGIEVGILKDRSTGRLSIIVSSSSLMKATQITRKGGVGVSNKGSWYLNTGYDEFKGGPGGTDEKIVFTAPILWIE